jgi:transcriptional regulator with XRE-family HTH domain
MVMFGKNIRKARKDKGLTQRELADLIGAKHNSISDWENDKNRPDPDSIELLLGALGVDANTLLGYDNKQNIAKDADELATNVLSNKKIQKMLTSLSTMSDSDLDLVISFIERLNK